MKDVYTRLSHKDLLGRCKLQGSHRMPTRACILWCGRSVPRLECRHELDEASLPWTAILQSPPPHGESCVEVFLTWTMNLDAIGPYCSGLGILRSTIADGIPMPSVRLELSHGAVGEIADMYSCAHDLLNALFPDKSAEEWKLVIKKPQAKRLRSKQKTKLGEYLVKTVTMSSENIETECLLVLVNLILQGPSCIQPGDEINKQRSNVAATISQLIIYNMVKRSRGVDVGASGRAGDAGMFAASSLLLLLFVWNTLTVSMTVSTTIPLHQDPLGVDVAGLQGMQ